MGLQHLCVCDRLCRSLFEGCHLCRKRSQGFQFFTSFADLAFGLRQRLLLVRGLFKQAAVITIESQQLRVLGGDLVRGLAEFDLQRLKGLFVLTLLACPLLLRLGPEVVNVSAHDEPRSPEQKRRAMSWAQRLKRVFSIDITTCAHCGGAVRIVASIEEPTAIRAILAHFEKHGALEQAHYRPAARAPPPAA